MIYFHVHPIALDLLTIRSNSLLKCNNIGIYLFLSSPSNINPLRLLRIDAQTNIHRIRYTPHELYYMYTTRPGLVSLAYNQRETLKATQEFRFDIFIKLPKEQPQISFFSIFGNWITFHFGKLLK